MIKGTLNQLHNISNPYQGDTKKVLTVCSAGLLRSATLQNVLIREYNYNVRCCGTEDYALVPVSEALLLWADEIIFVDGKSYFKVIKELEELDIKKKCYVLNIPDMYSFNESILAESCLKQYNSKNTVQ